MGKMSCFSGIDGKGGVYLEKEQASGSHHRGDVFRTNCPSGCWHQATRRGNPTELPEGILIVLLLSVTCPRAGPPGGHLLTLWLPGGGEGKYLVLVGGGGLAITTVHIEVDSANRGSGSMAARPTEPKVFPSWFFT